MSQKIGQEVEYAINDGDSSPLNVSGVSDGASGSPVRNINGNADVLNTNNSDQYHSVLARQSLGSLMNGKSPKDFAFSQVYGKPQPLTQSTTKKPSSRHPNKSTQSMSLSQSNRLDSSHERLNSYENQHQYTSGDVPPSKYTLKSQALMKEILQGGTISSSISQKDERNQPAGSRHEGKMLLSEQQMYHFDKENKQKAHQRPQTDKEKQLIERLCDRQNSIQERELTNYVIEQQVMNECTFSPRLFGSIYSAANGSVSLGSREPNIYDQQMKVKQQYQNHLDALKESKENETAANLQDKPKLSQRTKQLSEHALEKKGLNETHVVDRLHYEKYAPEPVRDTNTYKPQISAYANSKHRTQRVDVQLFEDAKKRQQDKKSGAVKKEDTKKQAAAKAAKAKAEENAQKLQKKKNERVVASRFDREFQQAVGSIAFTKDPTRVSMPETITYLEMIEILQALRFISRVHSEENPHVATQVQRVWNQLSGSIENKPRVLVRNLEVFLFAVQNIKADADLIPFITEEDLQGDDHPSNQLNPDYPTPRSNNQNSQYQPQYNQSTQSNQNYSEFNQRIAQQAPITNNKLTDSKKLPIGSFDHNDNLYYSQDNVALVHKLFKDIDDNRRVEDRADRTQVRSPLPTFSYTPAISNASRRLAQEKRERVIGDLKSNEGFDGAPIDMNEILRYQQQLTRYQNEQQKLRIEDEKLRECTFHPQVKDFSLVEKYFSPRFPSQTMEEDPERSPSARIAAALTGEQQQRRQNGGAVTSTKSLGVHRSIELYSLAKPNNQRRDREKGDIEYERECDECTFSPDISHVKLSHFNGGGGSSVSHMDSVQKSGSKHHPNILEQKGVQKSIQRTKQGRLNNKLTQSLSTEGTTFSAKKRDNHQSRVHEDLIHEHHVHHRSETRSHPLHHNHSHYNRVVQSSPKPEVVTSPNHQDSQDFNPNLTGEPDSDRHHSGSDSQQQDYYLKNPAGVNGSNESNKIQQQSANSSQNNQFSGSKTIEEDRVPLLFVDVNIEDGKTARIIVYEGEKSEDLANKFAQEHSKAEKDMALISELIFGYFHLAIDLDAVMTGRLKDLLDQQINSLLTKIDEEVGSDHEEEEEEDDEDDDDNEHKKHSKKRNGNHVDHDDDDAHEKALHEGVHEHHHDHEDHVVYAEDHYDAQTSEVNHHGQSPNGVNADDDDDDDEHASAPASASKSGMTEEQIREMQMRALAITFKNYSEKPHDEQSEQQVRQHVDVEPVVVVQPTTTSARPALAFAADQESTPSSRTPQNIMDLHMRALATTFKNYSESEEKQKDLPTGQMQAASTNDIENMHMRAMATTYQNYSNNPERIATLPVDVAQPPLSSRSHISNYDMPPQTRSSNTFANNNNNNRIVSASQQLYNNNNNSAENQFAYLPKSTAPAASASSSQNLSSYVPQSSYVAGSTYTYTNQGAAEQPLPSPAYVRNSYQFEQNNSNNAPQSTSSSYLLQNYNNSIVPQSSQTTYTSYTQPTQQYAATSYIPQSSIQQQQQQPSQQYTTPSYVQQTQLTSAPYSSNYVTSTQSAAPITSTYVYQPSTYLPSSTNAAPLTPSSSMYAQYNQPTGQSIPYTSDVASSLNSYVPSQYASQTPSQLGGGAQSVYNQNINNSSIQDNHLKALASTFMNYSNNPEKFNP